MTDRRGEQEFPGRPDRVREARRFVISALAPGHPLRDTAELLVSELASNAILHSASGKPGGTFAVHYQLSSRCFRVEVKDDGGPTAPRQRVHHMESVTGRGLEIFDALANRWGVDGGNGGRVVWFELDMQREEEGGGAARRSVRSGAAHPQSGSLRGRPTRGETAQLAS